MNAKKCVLLVGATSFVGRRLAAQLPKRHAVVGTYHGEKHPTLPEQERMDITDAEETERAIRKISPDIVILVAAISSTNESTDRLCEVNVRGTANVVKALQKHAPDAKLIVFSSDQVFDGREGPYAEEERPNPVNAYGRSKAEAERFVATLQNHLILRCAVILGAPQQGNHPTFLTRFLDMEQPMKVFRDVYRTTLFVDDIPSILEALLERDERGIINLSNNDFLSYAEMGARIQKAFKTERAYEIVGCDDPAVPKRAGLRNEKLVQAVGFAPTSFSEMMLKIKKDIEKTGR